MLPSKNGISTDFKIILKEKSCGEVSLAGFCMKLTMLWEKRLHLLHVFFFNKYCGEWAEKNTCLCFINYNISGCWKHWCSGLLLCQGVTAVAEFMMLFFLSQGLLFLLLVASWFTKWVKSDAVSAQWNDCWHLIISVMFKPSASPPLFQISQGRDYVLPSFYL